jgi:hypothetical protein
VSVKALPGVDVEVALVRPLRCCLLPWRGLVIRVSSSGCVVLYVCLCVGVGVGGGWGWGEVCMCW